MLDRLMGAARAAGRLMMARWHSGKARVLGLFGIAAAEVGPLRLRDRPPMTRHGEPVWLGPDALRPGDVLLSSSEAVFGWDPPASVEEEVFRIASPAWWVRTFDGGGYSHASYFDGEMLVESTLNGVIRCPVATRVRGQRYVDVYRFESDDGQTLRPPDWPPEPVHAAANHYVGAPYASHDLVFGAVLALGRRADIPGHLDDQVDALFSRAMEVLRSVFVQEDQVHLTCSELVYRAFDEAHPPPRYRLRIDPRDPTDGLPPGLVPGLFNSSESEVMVEDDSPVEDDHTSAAVAHVSPELAFAALYLDHKHGDPLGAIGYSTILGPDIQEGEESMDPGPDFVTPRDLAESPSLRELGRLRRSAFPGS